MDHFKVESVPNTYNEAKDILKRHKFLRIDGPKSSGKTILAVKLMSNYPIERCLLLQHPTDIRHIRLVDISVVLIEDVAGKHGPDKQLALKWYRVFDVLLAAILAGKLSVITTTETMTFSSCYLPHHDLLQHCVTLTSMNRPYIKQDPDQPSTSELFDKQYDNLALVPFRSTTVCFPKITSLTSKESIDVGYKLVEYCTFMPNGELVICYGLQTHTVKIFTQEFKLRNKKRLNIGAFDIAVFSNNEIIVSLGDKTLEVLNVSSTIEKVKSFSLGMCCMGVVVKNNRIYILCESNLIPADVIKILTMDGDIVDTLNIYQTNCANLAVNTSGDRILVTTCTSNKRYVLCFDDTGKTLYSYTDSDLVSPWGLMFDSDDNFMVCGKISNNIHVVKNDGSKHRVILTSVDGIYQPCCFAYRESDKTLLVFKVIE